MRTEILKVLIFVKKTKNIIADLKDKNEVVYKCIVSDGSIRYICMHLTKYNENDILGILMDVTEQHTNLVRMKDERRCFTFALKSSKILFLNIT